MFGRVNSCSTAMCCTGTLYQILLLLTMLECDGLLSLDKGDWLPDHPSQGPCQDAKLDTCGKPEIAGVFTLISRPQALSSLVETHVFTRVTLFSPILHVDGVLLSPAHILFYSIHVVLIDFFARVPASLNLCGVIHIPPFPWATYMCGCVLLYLYPPAGVRRELTVSPRTIVCRSLRRT